MRSMPHPNGRKVGDLVFDDRISSIVTRHTETIESS